MRRIFKYVVAPGTFMEKIPLGSRFLDVQMQGDDPVMWWEVEDDAMPVSRTFATVLTGMNEIPPGFHYCGTFQVNEPPTPRLVFHLYVLEVS